MRIDKKKFTIALLSLSLMLFLAGCKKKAAPPPPPPPPAPVEKPAPPAPARPTISEFAAEPSTIERGQSATLRWSSSDATEAAIDQGIGSVSTRGQRTIYPNETVTYTLTVKGPGGTATQTATVNVRVPPPPPPAPEAPAPSKTFSDRLNNEVKDAYFDYDQSTIREDARATLTKDADALKSIFNDFSSATVMVEGHCDERGSEEYNLALGDRRATAAKEFLVQLGVSADKLRTISYGKDRPQCTEHNEECFQLNRRAHFSAGQ
jgi:peptidoglycan-associated lipoprotein